MGKEIAPLTPPPADKANTLKAPSPGTTAAKGKSVAQQEIRVRAYEKWKAAGQPIGKDLKFWLEAEQEVLPRH